MTGVLGAVIAGGRSRRFGSDKAVAELEGKTLIAHVLDRLRPQVDALIVCGRHLDDRMCVDDRPHSDLGPLGGMNSALHYGRANGFDAVLTVPCDVPDLPVDLASALRAAGPVAYLEDLPVIGLWPVSLGDLLDDAMRSGRRSVYDFARAVGAIPVAVPVANINTPDELASLSRG